MKTVYLILFIISVVAAGHAIVWLDQPQATAHFIVAAILAWLFWQLRETERR